MTNKTSQEITHLTQMIESDYNKIVKGREFIVQNHQWNKKGDGFEIFTLYKDTTPVVASSKTIILK